MTLKCIIINFIINDMIKLVLLRYLDIKTISQPASPFNEMGIQTTPSSSITKPR